MTIRKVYGLLEQPSLPPSLPVHQFKLFLVRSVVVTRGLMTHDNDNNMILLHDIKHDRVVTMTGWEDG